MPTIDTLLDQARDTRFQMRDAEVRTLMEAALLALEALPELTERYQSSLAQGQSLASCLKLSRAILDSYFDAALNLCRSEEFLPALPLALYCSTYSPEQRRHLFVSASCLQRLGASAVAADLYRRLLQRHEQDVASAYRLGECLWAMGDSEAAAQMFEWTLDLSRCRQQFRSLQLMAERSLSALRAS